MVVVICSQLFTVVHSCSQLFTVVHSCSHVFTVVQRCSHLLTLGLAELGNYTFRVSRLRMADCLPAKIELFSTAGSLALAGIGKKGNEIPAYLSTPSMRNKETPVKSKKAARGPQIGRRGLESGPTLGYWLLQSTFAK